MKNIEINDRDRQMLELLAMGASNRSIAESLGYREGTMRVYLHGLYRKLGVGNKTSAVIWYFDRLRQEGKPEGGALEPLGGASLEESFGDMALRTSPFIALGAMGMFLGAYGRLWEVANRLKGAVAGERADHRRRQSRLLWEAMLKGDFGYGKKLYDDDLTARLLVDSPSDCVLLGCLLRIGGYTMAADRVMTQLVKRKKGRVGISNREATLLGSLRDALDANLAEGAASLHRLATENSAKSFPRHAAMVALFWLQRARKDLDAARATANALVGRGRRHPATAAGDGRAPARPEGDPPFAWRGEGQGGRRSSGEGRESDRGASGVASARESRRGGERIPARRDRAISRQVRSGPAGSPVPASDEHQFPVAEGADFQGLLVVRDEREAGFVVGDVIEAADGLDGVHARFLSLRVGRTGGPVGVPARKYYRSYLTLHHSVINNNFCYDGSIDPRTHSPGWASHAHGPQPSPCRYRRAVLACPMTTRRPVASRPSSRPCRRRSATRTKRTVPSSKT